MRGVNQFSYLLLVFAALLTPKNVFAQFEEFANSYSLLSTIAGKGELDNSGEIGWKPEFENGNALDAELTRPHFAMADAAGNIYIADKDAHGIRKLSPDGKIYTIAGTNQSGDNGDTLGIAAQLSYPNGIWVSAEGTVYILDLGNNKIKRLDTSGNLMTIVDDQSGISLGRGIWVTPGEDSIFYASGSQVKLWTESTGVQTYASGFSGLGNICMDKNSYLIASDRSGNRVYRISKDGTTKEVIAGNGIQSGGGEGSKATETGLHGVRGVWFLEDNSYFVATHEGSKVWYIDTGGIIHLFLDGRDGDEFHSGDGENYRTPGYKISEPRSVSVDYDGNVLIVENDQGFVRKIKNDYTYFYTSLYATNNGVKEIVVYPNPVQSEVFFNYELEVSCDINISVHNNLGEEFIRISEFQDAGDQTIGIGTTALPNGIYFLTLSANNTHETRKIVVMK